MQFNFSHVLYTKLSTLRIFEYRYFRIEIFSLFNLEILRLNKAKLRPKSRQNLPEKMVLKYPEG